MVGQIFLKRSVSIVLIGLICGAIMIILQWLGALRWIEYKSHDFIFLCRGTVKPDDRVIVIGTDEEGLEKIKDPFIFWSPYFAEVIKAVSTGGAKVIGLDFLQTIALKKKVEGEDLDGIMANALSEAENVIMINLLKWDNNLNGFKAINPLPRYLYASDPENVGFSNLTIDNDGCVRRQSLLLGDAEGNIYAYIGLKAVAKYFDSVIERKGDYIIVGDYAIPVNSYNEMLINFAGPSGTFTILPFYKIWQQAHSGNYDFFTKTFKDKIVLIGPGNIYSQDFQPTPFYRSRHYAGIRQTLGVEIMANVINTIMDKRFINLLKFWQTVLIILFIGVLLSFTSFKLSPVIGGITTFAIAFAYFYLCIFLFSYYKLNLNPVYVIGVIPITYTAVFIYRYNIEDKEKRRVKKIFKHYVSEDVVEEILKHRDEIPLGGQRVQVSVLFADIRGFTSLSENRDPQEVVAILNSYFSMMVDIILKNKGTLDKYIGDGILAYYGAPIPREEHADLAVGSAVEMVSKLDVLNKGLLLDNPLSIGVGIHSGDVVVGNIGSRRKMEYTIIGDTVNTASRVEGLTKELKASVLITDYTFSRLKTKYNITPEKEIIFRGKTKPIMLYRVEA